MTSARVLIAEDEAIGAMFLRHTLERMGVQVVAMVASGLEAIDAALSQRPDFVLMDVKLQGEMDGVTAAKEIMERGGIPAVFISAFTPAEFSRRYGMRRGDFRYLAKPVMEEQLRRLMEEILTEKSTAQADPPPDGRRDPDRS